MEAAAADRNHSGSGKSEHVAHLDRPLRRVRYGACALLPVVQNSNR